MQIIAGLAFVLLVVSSLVVGGRLLLLARRTREIAELSLGTSLMLLMGVAYPMMIALQSDHGLATGTARVLMVFAIVVLDVSFWLVYVFTWRVFRPDARWPIALVATAAGVLALHVVLVARTLYAFPTLQAAAQEASQYGLLSLSVGASGYAWAGIESAQHWQRLVRRLRIGLIDPMICHRFLLFATMSLFTVLGAVANLAYLALGIDVLQRADAMFITAMTGLGQAVCLWLTFLPPAAYERAVRARAEAHEAN